MIHTRAFDLSLSKWGVGLPIPYRIIEGFNDGGVELLADSFIDRKEACRDCFFHCAINLLMEDTKAMFDFIADYSVDDHRLYLCAGWRAKGGNLGLNELIEIHIIPVLVLSLVAIDVRLALGMCYGFCICKIFVKLDFQHSTLEHREGSWLVHIRRPCSSLVSGTARSFLNAD